MVLSWEELASRLAPLRAAGKRVVFTNGCFDLLHVGHVRCLEAARRLGDVLIVGVNSDASVRHLKGPGRPLLPAQERAELVAALGCVDFVTLFEEPTPERLLAFLKPDVHAKGADYHEEDLPEAPLVRSWGGEVRILPLTPGRSTTELVKEAVRRAGCGVRGSDSARAKKAPIAAIGVIPARYASTRLPGKPLLSIAGKPMIQHVYERARAARSLSSVLVATDDERIAAAVREFGGEVVMTSPGHRSGTDRVAEATRERQADVVVNIQGDEPLLEPQPLNALVSAFAERPGLEIATLATPIPHPEDATDPAAVKVVTDREGFALYFSRLPIPFYRDGQAGAYWRHLGVYAYRKEALLRFASLTPTPLEQAEALEQLRALEHGMRILVLPTQHEAIGVDTPEDLERVRRLMAARGAP